MNILLDKHIVLGVTGSIAAYKAAALASRLYQSGARVRVAMTEAATHFVGPLTFESLTHAPVARDVLALGHDSEIEHIALAHQADLVLVAPATANTLAHLAYGMAGDAVSAIVLDTRAPILLAPAMETGMWENTATQENLQRLAKRGMTIVAPGEGHLASGAEGKGRMAEPEVILAAARALLARNGPLAGKRVLVTAGGTREPIDPVRVIANHSSGKMGYALAEEALSRGAAVSLITSVAEAPPLPGVAETRVNTTRELYEAVLAQITGADVLIMAAAPADFRVRESASQKIKKEATDALTLELVRNPDILAAVAERRKAVPAQAPRVVIGFAAETENLLLNARAKLERKKLDLVVANPVPQTFGSDRVQATLVSATRENHLDVMSKEMLAAVVLDQVESLLKG